MEYQINGLRKQNDVLQTHVIRPDGNCGWEEIQSDKIMLKEFPGYESPASIKLPEDHIIKSLGFREEYPTEHAYVALSQKDMAQIATGKYTDLSNAFILNLNISGDFYNANFEGADIRECRLVDVDFTNCNFKGTSFSSDCKACQFIHNNFTDAYIRGCRFDDTVFDCNNFENTHFQKMSFHRFTVIKDNAFLRSTFDNVTMGHVDVRGVNKHLNTIQFTMGGATDSEIESMKKRCLDSLTVRKADQIKDMKPQDIDWAKVEKIYEYEVRQHIPEEQRVTEWFGDYGMAVPKMEARLLHFDQRYDEAVYDVDWKPRDRQGDYQKSYADAVAEVMQQAEMEMEDPFEETFIE